MAVQLVRAMTAARVMELTGGLGAHVVLDFAGAPSTVGTAGAVARVDGDVTIVGIGGGALPVGFGTLPYGAGVCASCWGSRKELAEVLDLAHAGAVDVHVETYSLDEAPPAYERLRDDRINGRAVILPGG